MTVNKCYNCYYSGENIGYMPSTGEKCEGICYANFQCTHFAHGNGYCFMFSDFRGLFSEHEAGWTCGNISSRLNLVG